MSDVIDISGAQEGSKPAVAEDQHLSFTKFDQFCLEVCEQPMWRNESDKCADYYDGNQIRPEDMAQFEQRGIGPLITNLVKPTVDMVLGMEAKTRTDWRVQADSDSEQEIAEALSAKLMEAERETRADRACSDGYAGQIKAGMGWVEVSRQSDPFKYPHRVLNVHRREIFWDWLSRQPDLDDARYLVRKRFFDIDALQCFFPQHADLIKACGAGWNRHWLERSMESPSLMGAFNQQRGWAVEDYEWRDTTRGRLCMFEVYYRQHVRGHVLQLPDRTVELDMRNPLHVTAVGTGRIRPQLAVFSKIRKSLWLGPHRLMEVDHKSKRFPYIPFWGYREDLTGVPYGLIRAMISPQDEINARRQKLMWLLSAKRVTMDEDALATKYNSIEDVLEEIARADSVVVLNKARQNKEHAFKVESDLGLSQQQFNVLEESKTSLQQAAGIYQAMMGDGKQGATSGIAITSLVEQGTTTLAEINDNYRFGRRQVGEQLVEQIRADMRGVPVQVMVGEQGRRRIISLNQPAMHPEMNVPILKNDTERSSCKVALEDVPSTPSYRAQQLTMLTETMKGMPPQLQALLAPFYIEATELPKRRQIAQLLRRTLQIPDDGDEKDPVKMQQAEQAAAAAQQQAQLAMRAAAADVAHKEAMANKINAEAEKARAEVSNAGAGGQLQQQMAEEIAKIKEQAQSEIDGLSAKLTAERATADQQIFKLTMDIDNAQKKADADVEKAKIAAQTSVRIAEIESSRDKVVDKFAADLKKLREDMLSQIKSVAAEAEKREMKREAGEREGRETAPTIDVKPIAEAVAALAKTHEKAGADADRRARESAQAVEKAVKDMAQSVDKAISGLAKQGAAAGANTGKREVTVRMVDERAGVADK